MNLGCKLNRPAFSAPTFRMSRLRLKAFDYRDPEATFFVTARAYDRTSPFVDARIAEGSRFVRFGLASCGTWHCR